MQSVIRNHCPVTLVAVLSAFISVFVFGDESAENEKGLMALQKYEKNIRAHAICAQFSAVQRWDGLQDDAEQSLFVERNFEHIKYVVETNREQWSLWQSLFMDSQQLRSDRMLSLYRELSLSSDFNAGFKVADFAKVADEMIEAKCVEGKCDGLLAKAVMAKSLYREQNCELLLE